MPLLMAVCVAFGIVIGTFYANHFSGNRLNIINSGSNRLNNLLHIIDDQYVDNVNIDSLVDKAIPQILSDLDPHSVYITAKDMQAANDELKGSFSGVGIEFNIREDTLHVQNVIKNAPAERAGLLAGDKVVSIDGKPFVGKTVTNDEAGTNVGDLLGQETRLLDGLFHGDVAVGGGIAHEAQDFAVNVRFGVDVDAAFYLGAQAHFGVHGAVFDAGLELLQRGQYFFAVVADTGDDAHAGDDDAFHVWGFSWLHG